MIITVSRRTDIPALYSKWFFNRLKEGFAYSINPFNPKQIKKVSLRKEDVTAFVFWSKNPTPFLAHLDELKGYHYYFQITLTPYDKEIEPNLPSKDKLIDTFINLSNKIGKEKVIWRYDPIMLTDTYTVDKHILLFEEYAKKLSPYTEKVIISFVDVYHKNKHLFERGHLQTLNEKEIKEISSAFSTIARAYNLLIETCGEAYDLTTYGITKTKCTDDELISKLIGQQIIYDKENHQRQNCLCTRSIDIGQYDSCTLGCVYCYAVRNHHKAMSHRKIHNPKSPILFGELNINDSDIKTIKKDRTLFD